MYTMDEKDRNCHVCRRPTEYITAIHMLGGATCYLPQCATHRVDSVEQICVYNGEIVNVSVPQTGFEIVPEMLVSCEDMNRWKMGSTI